MSAASTPPAPNPYGTAKTTSIQNCVLSEKANSASAVIPVLTAVTGPAPNRFVSLSLIRLETIVPSPMVIDMMLAKLSGELNSTRITGHAEPSSESGSPRLIKLK